MSLPQLKEGKEMIDKKEKLGKGGDANMEPGQKASEVSREGIKKAEEYVRCTKESIYDTTKENARDATQSAKDQGTKAEDTESMQDTEANIENVATNISIFDNRTFATTEECVQYMVEKHGFFIPDAELLEDLDGLLEYLGKKVKLGGYCLYCQERFAPGKPCQEHMINASHCKLRYNSVEDKEEFEDFYNFELNGDSSVAEDNANIALTDEMLRGDERIEGQKEILTQDTCKPALDPLRKELLRLGRKCGDLNFSAEELAQFGDADVIAMLIKYQQDVRKGQMAEARLQQKKEDKNQRFEFKDRVNKARTSEIVTRKISGYQGVLM